MEATRFRCSYGATTRTGDCAENFVRPVALSNSILELVTSFSGRW